MTSRYRSKVLLTLAAVAMATLVFTSVSVQAAPLASFDFHGHGAGPIQSGDPSNVDGLILSGQVGNWATLPAANTSATQRQGTSGSYTFTYNVGGAEMLSAWVAGGPDDLRRDYYYLDNPNRYSAPVPWEISGLDAGSTYDIILFGRGSDGSGDALFSIPGHDAGNGVGNAVTLDSENDGNFLAVTADGSGVIAGFMDTPAGTNAGITGVQFAEFIAPTPPTGPGVPEPTSIAIWSLLGLCLAGYGYRRRRRNS